MSSAGKWQIEVGQPHPCWVKITYGPPHADQFIHSIHHKDLRDLEHAVNRAILEARDLLPESHKHEMD